MGKEDKYGLTPTEWNQINPGQGKPRVTREGNLTKIIYPDGTTITSHKSVEDYGFVLMLVKGIGQVLMLPVALVRTFHGDPCEKQSRLAGGDGYPRKK